MHVPRAASRAGIATIACVGLCLGWSSASARQDDHLPYPDGYRRWTHVKSTIVGPEAPGAARNGGIHHFYANARALEGYRDGLFPDGSMLVDELLEPRTTAPGITAEGSRRRLSLMVKDAQRFRATGGWGFEEFPEATTVGVLSTERRASCMGCHAKGQDSVMTRLRP